MQFNSYLFILLFFPAIIILYHLTNRINYTLGKILLILSSVIFYIYGAGISSIVLLGSIALNYLGIKILIKCENSSSSRKFTLVLGIIVNVFLLVIFKYVNFLLQCGGKICNIEYKSIDMVLPLAISFYTFQQISLLVEVYKGNVCQIIIIDYLLYILYFPTDIRKSDRNSSKNITT